MVLATYKRVELNSCYLGSLQDPETNVVLLRNVCFWIDINGAHALRVCFEKATPSNLPINFAHILVNIITNVRLFFHSFVVVVFSTLTLSQ
jgi:hypothetical protein